MKFDKVLSLLRDYRTPRGDKLLFLLQPHTMRSIYDCVLHTGARDCLELGTGYGATTCVIAAALDELGGGQVTTLDIMAREPIGVHVLARHTGLGRYIQAIEDKAGYNWYLQELVARQTIRHRCAPCLDFCFLDGAHEWGVDALAAFLVAKLLRPDGWLALDDLDFKLRGCQDGWETTFADRTEKELDACQVGLVFDLVLRQHPDFANFTTADAGRTGWARKKSMNEAGGLRAWQPSGLCLDTEQVAWQQTFKAADIVRMLTNASGLSFLKQGADVAVTAKGKDPRFTLADPAVVGRPIDVISFRLRLLAPAAETLQVFWKDRAEGPFVEENSIRVRLPATSDWHALTIRLNGARQPRVLHALRIDPVDGPSSLLWDSLTIAGRDPRAGLASS
jgi:predicted O-methyltransferase YrrM